jgi:3-oxoacyl-[acyl-carrier-protein] synthase-3
MKTVDSSSVGMRSLAVTLPSAVRTNEYYRTRHPEIVAEAERKTLARVWSKKDALERATNAFDVEMLPYVDDPFRGTVERRILGPGQTALALEVDVARKALVAARMTPGDIDLMLVTSFLPDQPGPGNAAFLARELGLKRPAWNLESTCSSALIAFETACALVQAGHYRSILVVVSCTYSRVSDDRDTLTWFLGDGAGAFVVGSVPSGEGLLGHHTTSTSDTCGTFYYARVGETAGDGGVRIQCTKETGRILQESAEPLLRECCDGALRAASLGLKDIDFFVVNTPTAWYAPFCTRALGVDESRTISTYRSYANIGPALMPVNLHRAAQTGRIKPNDLVLLYTVGSVSTASAAIMRWGEVGLGPAVESSTSSQDGVRA